MFLATLQLTNQGNIELDQFRCVVDIVGPAKEVEKLVNDVHYVREAGYLFFWKYLF